MERFLALFTKRIIPTVLILSLCITSLCACKKDDSANDIRNFIYSSKEIMLEDIEEGPSSFSNFRLYNAGDEVLLYGTENGENSNLAHFVYLSPEGEINFYYQIPLGPDHFVNIAVSEEGDVFGLLWTKDREEDFASDNADTTFDDTEFTDTEFAGTEYADADYVDMEYADTEYIDAESVDAEPVDVIDEVVTDGEMSDTEMTDAEYAAEEYSDMEYSDIEYSDMDYSDMDYSEGDFGEPVPEEPEERTSENGYYFELCKINNNGEVVIDKNLQDYPEIRDLDSVNSEWAISSMIADKDYVYIWTEEGDTISFDHDLNLKNILSKNKTDKKLHSNGSFALSKDNELYVNYMDAQYNAMIAKADLISGKVEALGNQVPGEKYYVNLYKGINRDFSIIKNNILYEFNAGDNEYTEIMDFVASNIPTDYVSSSAGVDSTHFYALFNSMEDNSMHLALFTKVDPSTVQEKTIINLATLGSNETINKAVIDFNKSHSDYNIRIVDYNSIYGTGERWEISEEAVNKLNTDIISGKMPDILIQNENTLPLQTYINKGLLEDLNIFIDNDSEFSRDDFLPNVLEALSKDGHLYSLTPGYSVNTILVKQSLLNGRTSWDMDEALEVLKESGAQYFFDKTMTRDEVMSMVLTLSSSQFYDFDTAQCDFNSENFKEVLRFIETFPSDVDWGKLNIDWNEYQYRYKNNSVLAYRPYITNLSSFVSSLRDMFNEPVAYMGCPTTEGNGSSISTSIRFCISSKSKYKDVCWDFLRYFLTEDFQANDKSMMEYSLPIRKDVFEEEFQKMQKELYYEWTWMGETEIEPMMMMDENGEMVPVPPFTEEEALEFKNFFLSTNTLNETDSKVIQILLEECTDYFAGKSTIDDCAKRIQSRVQIYLYESQ